MMTCHSVVLRAVMTCLVLALPGDAGMFDPRVSPREDCRDPGTPCEFRLEVTHGEAMVWYNPAREEARPLLYTDGGWRVRTAPPCNRTQPANDTVVSQTNILDGVYRRVYLINDQFPGPTLVVTEGQQVVVRVKNNLLQEGLTIHWHGMVQKNTNWMDGVAGVTQCNINPGEEFTYRFIASPAGTHWYHSHLGAQRTDGLYGALIVLPRPSPTPAPSPTPGHPTPGALPVFSRDYVLMVQDWYHKESADVWTKVESRLQMYMNGYGDLDRCVQTTQSAEGATVGILPFQAGLINGQGRFWTDAGADETIPAPRARFSVSRNTFVRFRGINPSYNFAFRLSIDMHKLHVITSDGNDVQEVVADHVTIHVAERFDFYIETNQEAGNYWIRATTIERFAGNIEVRPGHVLAILQYDGAGDEDPPNLIRNCTAEDPCVSVNCPFREFPAGDYTDCVNMDRLNSTRPSPLSGDESHVQQEMLNFNFAGPVTPGAMSRAAVNGRRMILPDRPPAVYGRAEYTTPCDNVACETRPCHCTHQVNITRNDVIHMVLINSVRPNGTGVAHPVHLHGHHFEVIKTGYPVTDPVTKRLIRNSDDFDCGVVTCSWKDAAWNANPRIIPGLRTDNPPMKDTVIVPVGGYVIIRFKADNPGWWIMHCHLEQHQIEGMSLIVQEGDLHHMNPAPEGFPTCTSFNWGSKEFEDKLGGVSDSFVFWGEHGKWIVLALALLLVLVLLVSLFCFCRQWKKTNGYQPISSTDG